MRTRMLAFLAGNMSLLALPSLVWANLIGLAIGVLIVISYLFYRPLILLFISFLFGFAWTYFYTDQQLSASLPRQLHNKFVVARGHIVSIPSRKTQAQRFDFKIEQIDKFKLKKTLKARVYWYKNDFPLKAGQYWQLYLKLKPPRGFANPGGFDYEKYLFVQGIKATAYVKLGLKNKLLADDIVAAPLTRLRQVIADTLDIRLAQAPLKGFIKGLTIGVTSDIKASQWQVLRATGTNHLLAISGLHIGLIAAVFYQIARFVWSRFSLALIFLPAQSVATIVSWFGAVVYAALAGFSLPTQRALIMLSVFLLAQLLRRQIFLGQGLLLAAFIIIAIDPFASLSSSFWLSLMAVAWIFYGIGGRLAIPRWRQSWQVQWMVTWGLAPLTLYIFGQVSLVSIAANSLAIPVVGMVVVPLALASILLYSIWPSVGDLVLTCALTVLEWIYAYLSYLSEWHFSLWQFASPSFWVFSLLVLAVLLLFAPSAWPGKRLGWVFLLPMILPGSNPLRAGEFKLTVLDVGQGTAIVIRTQQHTVLYDTGPKFSDNFTAGRAVILPFLQSQGIKRLDTLIISHADNDHIGGLQDLLPALPIQRIYSNSRKKISHPQLSLCLAGKQWTYDGVSFSFLYPTQKMLGLNNDSSCVLAVRSGKQQVILSGDIEQFAESQIIQQQKPVFKTALLIAPHHGSKTSSSVAFLEWLQPERVIFPVGYLNQFRFPHRAILQRYRDFKVKQWRTDYAGAITVIVDREEKLTLSEYRKEKQHLWQQQDKEEDG